MYQNSTNNVAFFLCLFNETSMVSRSTVSTLHSKFTYASAVRKDNFTSKESNDYYDDGGEGDWVNALPQKSRNRSERADDESNERFQVGNKQQPQRQQHHQHEPQQHQEHQTTLAQRGQWEMDVGDTMSVLSANSAFNDTDSMVSGVSSTTSRPRFIGRGRNLVSAKKF